MIFDLGTNEMLTAFSYLVPVVALLIGVILIYLYWWKPRVEYPLQGEDPLGYLQIYLPRGLGVHEGYATTAKRTVEKWWSDICNAELDKKITDKLEESWKVIDDCHPIAHRVGKQIFLYLFDMNPMDQKFMDRLPNIRSGRIITGVQDAVSVGSYGNINYVGVKLNPDPTKYTPPERKDMKTRAELIKYLKDSAKNTQTIHLLKEEVTYTKEVADQALKDKADMRSELDKAKRALSTHPLTATQKVEVPGEIREKLKQWFTWPQFIGALIGYLSSGYILELLQLQLEPSLVNFFTAGITVLGFFIIPLIRKILGRF